MRRLRRRSRTWSATGSCAGCGWAANRATWCSTAPGAALIVASGRDLVLVSTHGGARPPYLHRALRDRTAGGPARSLPRDRRPRQRSRSSTCTPAARAYGRARATPSVNGVNGMMSASPNVLLVASTGQSRGQGDLLPAADGPRRRSTASARPSRSPRRRWSPRSCYLRVSADQRTWFVDGLRGKPAAQRPGRDDVGDRRRNTACPLGCPAGRQERSRAPSRPRRTGASSPWATAQAQPTCWMPRRAGSSSVDSSSSTVASGDLALAAGDKLLVTASLDGLLRTWSAQGSEQSRLETPPDTEVGVHAGRQRSRGRGRRRRGREPRGNGLAAVPRLSRGERLQLLRIAAPRHRRACAG